MMMVNDSIRTLSRSESVRKDQKELSSQWALEHTSQIEQMVRQSQKCQTLLWELPLVDHSPLPRVEISMLLQANMMTVSDSTQVSRVSKSPRKENNDK